MRVWTDLRLAARAYREDPGAKTLCALKIAALDFAAMEEKREWRLIYTRWLNRQGMRALRALRKSA